MLWPLDRKLRACIDAPLGPSASPSDTRVVERDGWFQRITPSARGSWQNEVLISRVAADDAERVIHEVVAEYRALGKPTKWCIGPWTEPDDFGERLARRGFSSWATRGMGCATDARIGAGEVRVRVVETARDVDDYVRTSARARGPPRRTPSNGALSRRRSATSSWRSSRTTSARGRFSFATTTATSSEPRCTNPRAVAACTERSSQRGWRGSAIAARNTRSPKRVKKRRRRSSSTSDSRRSFAAAAICSTGDHRVSSKSSAWAACGGLPAAASASRPRIAAAHRRSNHST